MSKLHFSILLTLIFLMFSAAVIADEKTDAVDKLFSLWDTTRTPGAVIAIVQDGKILYEQGYGMANLELNVALTPRAVLRTGSVSKQFTAACVALLAIEGKFDLNDRIVKYFPELPKEVYGEVQIRHLVHHTSGVRDYLTLAYLAGYGDFDYYTADEALGMLYRQKALNFEPGEEMLYSNSGYMLLALLVERISGKTLNQFATEHFFKPIGMKATQYYEDHTRIVPNRADGYSPSAAGYNIDMTTLDIVGDGGVLTTVGDMALWLEALQGRGPLDKALLELMTTTEPLNSGEMNDYAFGLGVTTYKGKNVITHGGAFVGFRADIAIYPDERFSVVCLSNLGSMRPGDLNTSIAEIYLFDEEAKTEKVEKGETTLAETTDIILSEEQLLAWEGWYIHPESEAIFKLWVENKVLHAKRHPGATFTFVALSESSFVSVTGIPGAKLQFSTDNSTGKRGFSVYYRGELQNSFIEFQPFSPDADYFAAVKGSYYSEELGVSYTFNSHEGELYFTIAEDSSRIKLLPTLENTFDSRYGKIRFTFHSSGKISEFTIDPGRVKGIRFVKR